MSNEIKSFKEWIKENENKWISAGIIAICSAIVMPITIYLVSDSTLSAESFGKLGTVGDFLGGSTVGLLSIASIFFLISTIVMQRKELGLQREELQMTREELVKANEQYEITNKTMKLQQFETTFFNLINLFNEVLKNINHSKYNTKGREALKDHFNSINKYYYKNSVIQFIYDFLDTKKSDYDERIKSFGEAIYYLMVNGYKDEQEFQLLDFHTVNSVDEIHELIEKTEVNRELQIRIFNYDSLDRLTNIIPNNMLVDSFIHNFLFTDFYLKQSFKAVLFEEDFLLANYIKNIKMIFNFIDRDSFLTDSEKQKYVNFFVSQFSIIETTIIHYYIKLGEDEVLNSFQQKYEIYSLDNIHGDSIILHML